MSDAAASQPCAPTGRALYVYYRVRPGQEFVARTAIETMQATLRPLQPGLSARLMCRADLKTARSDDDEAVEPTWMEVYEHPDGVSPACEATLATLASALPDGVFGPRHVEVFVAVVSVSPFGAPEV